MQQQLTALAVNLQLAGQLVDVDPTATKALLDEMGGDVQLAVDAAARLAQRIYPPLLETGGLGAALRAAAASANVPTRIEVDSASYPREVAGAVYFCFLALVQHAGDGARATVTVRREERALGFEVVLDGSGASEAVLLTPLRDRVEALDGRLSFQSEPGGGTRVAGSLPLPQ